MLICRLARLQERDKEAVEDCTAALRLKPNYIKVGRDLGTPLDIHTMLWAEDDL